MPSRRAPTVLSITGSGWGSRSQRCRSWRPTANTLPRVGCLAKGVLSRALPSPTWREWGKASILGFSTPCSPMRKVWLRRIQHPLVSLRDAEFQLIRSWLSILLFLPVTPHFHARNSAQTPDQDAFVTVTP